MRMPRRPLAWLGAGAVLIAVLVVVAIIVIITFDWNHAKPTINEKISAAIGRPFAIQGDLSVHWRRDAAHGDWLPGPVFTAKDIEVANPEWAHDKTFAHLDEVTFRVSAIPLLAHRITVRRVQLTKPIVHLEKQGDKRNNWTFDITAGDGKPSPWTLDLGELGFDAGTVSLDDPSDHIEVNIGIDPLDKPVAFADVMNKAATSDAGKQQAKKPAQSFAFGFKVKGKYNDAIVSGGGKTGGVLALRDADSPFPLQADLRIGDVAIGLTGTLTNPAALGAIDVHLRIAGNSMGHLYPIIGVTLPDTPPFETDGHLTGKLAKDASTFSYEGFNGRVGASDLHGSLKFEQKQPRPKLSGKLRSEQLQLADLGPLIGLDTGDKSAASKATPAEGNDTPKRPANGKVLPNDPFATERWKTMDADVALTGRRIVHGKALPISELDAHLILDGGALALTPLDFGFAGGNAKSAIHLDGRATPMKGDIKLKAMHLKLRELFPDVKTMQGALGEVNADLALSATGNSVAALLASSNGELKMLMNNGVMSRELMELAGLNVGNYVVVKLFGDEPVKINCAATDFVAKDGVMSSQLAAFDTENALINIDGSVNFGSEAIDLDITPHTKGLRVFSLRSPLYVKGTLGNPDVGVKKGPLIARGAGAVALGVLATPAAALLALIAPSNDSDADPCVEMLSKMRGAAKAPTAGKTTKPSS